MARTPQDIANLTLGAVADAGTQDWHPVLDTYARGVERMRDLPATDPQSWWWESWHPRAWRDRVPVALVAAGGVWLLVSDLFGVGVGHG